MKNKYNAENVVLSFNGEIIKGFSEGSFIIIEHSDDLPTISKDLIGTSIKDIPKELKLCCMADIMQ
jgi:hypothetical protein